MNRADFIKANRIVIKLGTNVLRIISDNPAKDGLIKQEQYQFLRY